MSLALEFLPEAAEEIAAVVQYYEQQLPGLGARFRHELESVCSAIVKHSLLWREVQAVTAGLTFPDFRITLLSSCVGN